MSKYWYWISIDNSEQRYICKLEKDFTKMSPKLKKKKMKLFVSGRG